MPSSSSTSSRPPRSSTSPSRTSRARPGTSPRIARALDEMPSWTGSPPVSAPRRARCGSKTTSDFAFKGALRDTASVVWRGMIKVEKDAQRTNAYQENRNLLLSDEAHADSIPGLEIEANDVRCTHGATVGQVDRDQLFYLMARGLSRGEAERLIVRGFFTDLLSRIELEPVREALGEALEARIPRR